MDKGDKFNNNHKSQYYSSHKGKTMVAGSTATFIKAKNISPVKRENTVRMKKLMSDFDMLFFRRKVEIRASGLAKVCG